MCLNLLWLTSEKAHPLTSGPTKKAGEGTRTLDNDVGNVVLYQLSYTRNANVPGGNTVKL